MQAEYCRIERWRGYFSSSFYVRLPGDPKTNCQIAMIDVIEKREKEEGKTRRRRRGFARRVMK